tara:strand:- start:1011 stop:1931 length:921 start_codon:yes stop_codon:yes gene_type:complete
MKPKMLVADLAEYMNITPGRLHQIINEKKIQAQKISNRTYLDFRSSFNILNIEFKKKVVSFQTVKGGVGKTTLCNAIGTRLNLYGARVLFVDIDQQANLTSIFNLDEEEKVSCFKDVITESKSIEDSIINITEGIDLLPSSIANAVIDKIIMIESLPIDKVLNEELNKIKDKYDFIFIDCPPAISPLVSSATLASDLVLSPLTPDKFGVDGLRLSANEVSSLNKKFKKDIEFKIIINKYDKRTLLSPAIFNLIKETELLNQSLLETCVGTSQDFSNASIEQQSIYCPVRQGTPAKDIDLVVRELFL